MILQLWNSRKNFDSNIQQRFIIFFIAHYYRVCGFVTRIRKYIAIMLSKIALCLDNIQTCLKYIEIPRHQTTSLLTEIWPMRDLELRRHQRINDFPLFMHMCDEYEGGTLVCGLMSHGILTIKRKETLGYMRIR